jgi:hypothetical protein
MGENKAMEFTKSQAQAIEQMVKKGMYYSEVAKILGLTAKEVKERLSGAVPKPPKKKVYEWVGDTPVDDLELDYQQKIALKAIGVNTLAEIEFRTDMELLRVCGIGHRSVDRIREAVRSERKRRGQPPNTEAMLAQAVRDLSAARKELAKMDMLKNKLGNREAMVDSMALKIDQLRRELRENSNVRRLGIYADGILAAAKLAKDQGHSEVFDILHSTVEAGDKVINEAKD